LHPGEEYCEETVFSFSVRCGHLLFHNFFFLSSNPLLLSCPYLAVCEVLLLLVVIVVVPMTVRTLEQ